MPFGQSNNEIFLSTDIKSAFAMCQKAGDSIGSVLECNPLTNSLTVKTRYGLQSVKLRISLKPQEGGTLISFVGAGDDIWGGGARKGIDKFIAALGQQ